jgi:hypothetical protein
MRRALYALALSLAFAAPAAAHHGKDFLLAESAELPHPRTTFFVSSERFSNSEFTSEPSILFGITSNFAGEVHVHFTEHGYEAIAPAIHVAFPSLGSWNFAASGEYEFASHENAFHALLIAARPIGNGQIVINGGTDAEYAIGYRPDMEEHTSWGIEAQGQLRHGEENQLILGIYTQPTERLTIKAGAGAILGTGKPGAVFRTGIVWHF